MQYQYFKYLDLDWKIASEKMANLYSNSLIKTSKQRKSPWLDVNQQQVIKQVPELVEMVRPLKATIRFIAFFISSGPGAIHTDSDPYSKCRINIPILNCDDTETQFFKCTGTPILTYLPNGAGLYRIAPETCTLVDAFKLTQPVLFRNTEPHKVVCNHDRVRISCTIGLHENLEYLL